MMLQAINRHITLKHDYTIHNLGRYIPNPTKTQNGHNSYTEAEIVNPFKGCNKGCE